MSAIERTPHTMPDDARAIETVPAVGGDANSLMAVISRAASDPNMDVLRLEKLLEMYERITARQAEQGYNNAMSAAQAEMRPIAADANNPQTKSKYASFAALDRVLRPIYTRHGFSLSYSAADGAPPEHVRVVCKVSHRDGHTERPYIDLPVDGKGAKGGDVMTKTHAMGAGFTYGQRYLEKAIFNIAVGDDLDGNEPMAGARPITDAQRDALQILCETVGADVRAFSDYMGPESLAALPARDYREAEQALQAKARKTEAAA